MNITNKDLKRRIIEISYKHKLSHLGSCLTAVDILAEIYDRRQPEDPVILSQGHAGLALYVVLEKHFGHDAEQLFEKHGVHPCRDLRDDIYCSTGSLGHGLPIAVGMALANKDKNVYCLVSDGEMAEGSIWEALRLVSELNLINLYIHFNVNGSSAYDLLNRSLLMERLGAFVGPDRAKNYSVWNTSSEQLPFLTGIDAHYYTMTETDYQLAIKALT